jgi:mannose-6-phosphate isomerase
MKCYPLKFKPIYKEIIWGGNKLKNLLNKDFPADKKIGESWELVDLPYDKSVIENGEFAGKPLGEILKKYPQQILGQKSYQPPFGLLIKFIDANDCLSVQVHPDSEAVKKLPNARLKTECWYIVDCEPDACIYKGLKAGTTRQMFEKAINDGSCAEFLNKVPVKKGQCHFLPAGTVHAIGAGNLIAEIQTPSDTTYRVFDWNRLQDGKPRQLHIAEALESIHFNQDPKVLTVKDTGRLVDCDLFKVDKIVAKAADSARIAAGDVKVIMFISGSGKIVSADTEPVNFSTGQTLLLPAEFNGEFIFDSETVCLSSIF